MKMDHIFVNHTLRGPRPFSPVPVRAGGWVG